MSQFGFAAFFLVWAAVSASADVRRAAVAGQFYPSDATELSRTVDGFLSAVPRQKVSGNVVALMVPHAGYMYSGQTAAYSYKLISGRKISTVVLIGNSHHVPLRNAAVYAAGSFRTPLGDIAVNEKLAARILSNAGFEKNTVPHVPEHSLEVQLPFLHRTLQKGFTIVPILLGSHSLEQCKRNGEAVARAIRELGLEGSTVIIASSDMSHYPSWANANMADGAALKAIGTCDPAQVKKAVESCMASKLNGLDCVLCGEESVYTAMYAARTMGADGAQVLHYANSGDVSGDRARVVGYGAVAFIRGAKASARQQAPGTETKVMNEFRVSEKAQKELLENARYSIQHYLTEGDLPEISAKEPELLTPAAVFVTLTRDGHLRGCIGTTEPFAPLYKAVSQLAVSAAVEDHRFPPLTLDELKSTHIEISVLSPMRRVKSAGEIKENEHGVVVRCGRRSGLFLPQVWEHFSCKDDFMNELCLQKAGLEPAAWKDAEKTELYVFTVFAFEEK